MPETVDRVEFHHQFQGGNSMKAPAQHFRDLIVWQHARNFVLDIYLYSGKLPRAEMFCLTSQIRRAAISVPANIAEGFKKRGKPDKLRFLNISQGSLEESKYYLIFSKGSWLWGFQPLIGANGWDWKITHGLFKIDS